MKIKASEIAYEKIKEKIILTELKPGEKIIENELMENLGLGRTPIREALTKLSNEGFIKIIPRKGMMVSEIKLEDLNKILDLRLELTGYISKQVVKHSTIEDINRIALLRDKNSLREKDYINYILIDLDFHLIIYELCRNKFLEELMKKMLYISARILVMKSVKKADVKKTLNDYNKLIDFIKSKDSEKLEKLLRQHINELIDVI